MTPSSAKPVEMRSIPNIRNFLNQTRRVKNALPRLHIIKSMLLPSKNLAGPTPTP